MDYHLFAMENSPPFRPILSAIDTPTYKLAKFLLKFLTPSTSNKYTLIHLTLPQKFVNRVPTYTWLV